MNLHNFVLLGCVCVSLVGCQSLMTPAKPVPLVNEPVAPAAPVAPVVQQIVPQPFSPSVEERLTALEGKMLDAEPKLKKIDIIDNHFRTMSLELKMLDTPVPPVVVEPVKPISEKPVVKKEIKPEIKKESKPEPKFLSIKKETTNKNNDTLSITSMRFGTQGTNGVRIVLDATKSAEMHYDLDNEEGLLVIDLPNAVWSAGKPKVSEKTKLITAADVNTDAAGSHLILQIAGKAKVVATGRLNPSGNMGNRVYLDIVPVK